MFAPTTISAVRASSALSLSPTRRRAHPANAAPFQHSPSRTPTRSHPPRPPTPPDSDGEMDAEDLLPLAQGEKWLGDEKQQHQKEETFVSPLGFELPVSASSESDYPLSGFPQSHKHQHQLPRYPGEQDDPAGGLPPSYSNSEKLENFGYPTPAVSVSAPGSTHLFFPSPEPSTASSSGSPLLTTSNLLPPAQIPSHSQHQHQLQQQHQPQQYQPVPIASHAHAAQQNLHIHVPSIREPSPGPPSSRPLSAIVADKYHSQQQVSAAARWLDTPAAWLALYFAFNLGLTLYNKGVLVKFPFPYTLTAVHALCGSIGCWIALELGYFKPQPLTRAEAITLGAFSVLYTVNIAVSNISLHLVTVPFHQVVRASTPLFTIALAATLMPSRGPPSSAKLLSLLPVVAGVGFATYGDYYFTAWGLFLTLLGTFLAACKTIVTNLLQSPSPASSLTQHTMPSTAKRPHERSWSVAKLGKLAKLSGTSFAGFRAPQLHPLDLLLRMSPLAFIQCVVYAYLSGELERVRAFGATEMTRGRATALMFNGVIAFGLNVVSFTANKRTGPLTMTVAANVKQVLTIVLAVMIFDLTITPTNLVGIMLTLMGGAWYGAIEYGEKKRKSRA